MVTREHLDQSREQVKKVIDELGEQQRVNQDMQKRLSVYRESFEDDLRIHAAYLEFSESTKNSLSGIFKDTSIQGLIACGIQEGSISNYGTMLKMK